MHRVFGGGGGLSGRVPFRICGGCGGCASCELGAGVCGRGQGGGTKAQVRGRLLCTPGGWEVDAVLRGRHDHENYAKYEDEMKKKTLVYYKRLIEGDDKNVNNDQNERMIE